MAVLSWRTIKRWAVRVILLAALLSLPFAFGLSGQWRPVGAPGQSVGVVRLSGTIQSVIDDPLGEGAGIEPVVAALTQARKDKRVGAVVVRINSPGGSAAASQEVHRAILKVREAGKPVVVSMADIAASGGYYVAVAADRILANPSTITGSIGVYAQFLDLSELAAEYGVKLHTVKTGPYKDIGNPTEPFTESERQVIQAVVEDSLDQFIAVIAEGRNMSPDQVRRLADGRMYTGNQARDLGLIDDFGGLEDAVRLAAELAGIEGEPNVIEFGRRRRGLLQYLRVVASGLLAQGSWVEKGLVDLLRGEAPSLTIRY